MWMFWVGIYWVLIWDMVFKEVLENFLHGGRDQAGLCMPLNVAAVFHTRGEK